MGTASLPVLSEEGSSFATEAWKDSIKEGDAIDFMARDINAFLKQAVDFIGQ